MMTSDARETLEQLAKAATPGPWDTDEEMIEADGGRIAVAFASARNNDVCANAAYIAAANPSTILTLLADLKAAEERLREISDLLADAGIPGGTTIYGGVLTLRERAEKAETELAQLNDALTERETWRRGNFGLCAICGTTVWHTDGCIQDERGVMHPLCPVEKRAKDAEAVLRDLEWIGMNDGRGVTHLQCPACSALKSRETGHNHYCGLAAALKAQEPR